MVDFNNTISSANTTIALSVPGVFPASFNLEGFSTDASISLEAFKSSEPRMGIDAHLAAGYIPTPKVIKISFEANSPSFGKFITWDQAQATGKTVFTCEMVVTIPSIGKRYTYVKGFLSSSQPMSAGKKVLDPTEWEITFEAVENEDI